MVEGNSDENEDEYLDEEEDGEEYEDEDDFEEGEEDEDFDEEDEDDTLPRLEPERANAYDKTVRQLHTFHRELSIISKKMPDSPLNKFKLGLVNETLEKANFVLGDEFLPFSEFRKFDEANMPSASDVVLMLSHYMGSLRALRNEYCVDDEWRVIGDEHSDEESSGD